MSPYFPSLDAIPENADAFASTEFCASAEFSIQAVTSAMTDTTDPTYTVMGSNISPNVGDMVNVLDESGTSGARNINLAFVRKDFPYKWIGIQYSHGANGGAGNLTILMEQKNKRVTIVG